MMKKLSGFHFTRAPNIVVEPPGPKAKKLLEEQKRIESEVILYPHFIPLVPESGRGATLKDVDENIFIDFFGGISVCNVGHSNPVIIEAIQKQMAKLVHALDFPTTIRLELVKKLMEIAPGDLRNHCKISFGSPSGSDAVEAAVKLAKHLTQRFGVMAFEGSYHGQSAMTLALSSKKTKEVYYPLVPEIHFLPYAYCYRCRFNLKYPKCGLRCAKYVKHIIEDLYSGVIKPSAIIVEPIQGEGGIIVPPNDWLPAIKKICDKNNIILIADEIQAGMGRTGKMWSCEHSGITPDVMTMAKAIGGIGLPLAAIAFNEKLDTWGSGAHLGTFRGHLTAMAAGSATIDFMKEYDLVKHSEKLGEKIIKQLKNLEESKYVGEIRGKGLMIAVEFIKNKDTKEPFKTIVNKIQKECFKKGLLIWQAGYSSLRFLPPLVITEELADKGVEIFIDAVKKIEKEI